jgi:hypothetical protein
MGLVGDEPVRAGVRDQACAEPADYWPAEVGDGLVRVAELILGVPEQQVVRYATRGFVVEPEGCDRLAGLKRLDGGGSV